ncbi:MAG: response regulator [Proteobacteria bacterium]|nr:response regulator [Pseudomonadota bacterium]
MTKALNLSPRGGALGAPGSYRADTTHCRPYTKNAVEPCAASSSLAAGAGSHRQQADRARGAVLVIDDEPIVLRVTKLLLLYMGFTAHTSPGLQEGLRLFERHVQSLHAVLLDASMAEANLADTVGQLRRQAEVPIIVTSGYARHEVLADLGMAGTTDEVAFLQKPFRPDELASALSPHGGTGAFARTGSRSPLGS